jgi:phosphopantothenoylcysteine decarboxylase/phosphopantothenate--cysteine ligase
MKTTKGRFAQKRILLGVTGSIAAYKAVSLTRRLISEGATVDVVLTHTAQRFVTALTFEVLTGRRVGTDLFSEGGEGKDFGMPHLAFSESADLIVIAPASAHCLAKLAHGFADDLLSALILAAERPVVIAPAMDGGMWDHLAVRDNVRTLRGRGVTVLEPDFGPLASGRVGKGRFPEEDAIMAAAASALVEHKDFEGRRILITAGPTQEAIDPMRFLSNHSSGKMGWALAEAARDRGAQVTLVAGPTGLPPVANIAQVQVTTSEEMRKAVVSRFPDSDILIMAAAVADFRAAKPATHKIPKTKGAFVLSLEPTPDILAELPARRRGQLVVGFAAETGNLLERAQQKLRRKKLDLIVANDVTEPGAGFGTETNRVTLADRNGRCEVLPLLPKQTVAHRILDAVLALLARETRRK